MTQQLDKAPTGSIKAPNSSSTSRRVVRFVSRHPMRVVQYVIFSLVAVIVLQNLEATSIDVLFWTVSSLPKLVLIFFSMLVGAVAWELLRRLLLR